MALDAPPFFFILPITTYEHVPVPCDPEYALCERYRSFRRDLIKKAIFFLPFSTMRCSNDPIGVDKDSATVVNLNLTFTMFATFLVESVQITKSL